MMKVYLGEGFMDTVWKKEERLIAKAFNTKRRLMKGTDEKSDVISDVFCVDAKVQKNWSIHKWFRDVQKGAKDKIPILVVRKPKEKTRLVVISFDFLVALLKGGGFIKDEDSN